MNTRRKPPTAYYLPPAPVETPPAPRLDATKISLGLTTVAALIWAISQLVYNAGGKVATSDQLQRDLTQQITNLEKNQNDKIATLQKQIDVLSAAEQSDHDSLMHLQTSVDANKGNIDVLLRNQNGMPIQMNIDPSLLNSKPAKK